MIYNFYLDCKNIYFHICTRKKVSIICSGCDYSKFNKMSESFLRTEFSHQFDLVISKNILHFHSIINEHRSLNKIIIREISALHTLRRSD